ncbi:hypothetical protein DM02DRAFT_487798, partial [Periconia macrospinosa]
AKLKHHYPVIWLIVLYIPLLFVPWVATVVLTYRPISRSTYYYPNGFNMDEYKQMQSWVTAIDVLNSIASLLAVPVVSFIIAQTAVIFSQRRAPARQLSVRDIFALADRAWTDTSVLMKLVRAKGHGSRAFNGFIAMASGFLFVSAVQPPLYQILADWKSINIPSGILGKTRISDTGFEIHRDRRIIGQDFEPAQMEMIPHATVLQSVQSELSSFPQGDAVNSLINARYGDSASRQMTVPAFFAALPYNTTTGTMRYHAMRYNSSIVCEVLSKDRFPSSCTGGKPYETSIKIQNDTSSTELRICVPGTWGTFPWTLSRNRQDIGEEVYLQV